MPKNVLDDKTFIVNQDLSAGFTSQAINVLNLDNVSIQLNFPGATATGTFFVDAGDGINFVPLSFGSSLSLPDADNAIHIEMTQLGCSHIRVRYVATSGTGILNGTLQGKAI